MNFTGEWYVGVNLEALKLIYFFSYFAGYFYIFELMKPLGYIFPFKRIKKL